MQISLANIPQIGRFVFKEGFNAFAYRVWKLSRLNILKSVGYWPRLQETQERFWGLERVDGWLELVRNNKTLIGVDNISEFKCWTKKYPEQAQKILSWANQIDEGTFVIFDQAYQFDWDDLPWQTDWRWPFKWENTYYRNYDNYNRNRQIPYDIKFPWEISRFWFLIPLAQAAVITGDIRWQKRIAESVKDWENKNPVAHSINWCAMECAMRGIALSLVVQILASGTSVHTKILAPLLRQLTLQGEFLFKNIEYSKIRSNHYAANLVGLLVMGCTLGNIHGSAKKWITYSQNRLFKEIESQFCLDGVNFEKSISYHRLVTELFLLALIQLKHHKADIPREILERLRLACEYSRWYTRPDGLVPNWGDNDSARALVFDNYPIRCHKSLLDLAAAFFDDQNIKHPDGQPSSAVPLLLGAKGMRRIEAMKQSPECAEGGHYFKDGGVFISRSQDNFLFADFGEVGMAGTGGHGHNDTFSFELFLYGEPVIIDPGSPVYTGSLDDYDLYRSTESHNIVRVDGQEMARLMGTWQISNEAAPYGVKWEFSHDLDVIEGGHDGLCRLPDPITHKRKISFFKHEGRLICEDYFKCEAEHHVEQFFYLAAGLKAVPQGDDINIFLKSGVVLTMSSAVNPKYRIERTKISDNYGHKVDSVRIVMEYVIKGTSTTVAWKIMTCTL
jgi:hypothetical protein